MKKILFVIPEYSHGGTNKSLENLLALIDHNRYDISVYCLYEDGGDYYKKVFAPYVLRKSRLYYWLHDNVVTRKFMGLYYKLTKRNVGEWLYQREVRYLQKRKSYDVVVAYQEGTATQFVSYFKKCKKIAWNHSPYVRFTTVKSKRTAISLYNEFDHVVCVSRCFAKLFCEALPSLANKVLTIYNAIDNDMTTLMGQTPLKENVFDISCFSIVSIGRFCPQKQFECIPDIAKELICLHGETCFKWYIIASGDECREKTEEKIKSYHLEDRVILLGARDNPYPYIKQSDLVVCTSESESFSYVIAEAKVLHTPVLSNDFPVAYEVVDEQMGWIANIKDMPLVLARIIGNVDGEYDRKKRSCADFRYDNREILQKIELCLK